MSHTNMDGLNSPKADSDSNTQLPDESNPGPSTTHPEFTEDFAIASILMVAYLTETVVQAFLIFDCYRSSYLLLTTNWLWILFLSWLFTSILVTIISMIWTQRGMDFSGRLCGQLLCYLMHCLLLGLLWRYLKIALAYDKADVVEFFKLRTLQIYVQALPLVIIHLVFLISPVQGYERMASWMIAGEIFSVTISLVLYSLSKPKLDFICENNYKEQRHLTIQANVTSRILFLISRVLALALFISSTSYWSLLAILTHLVFCQTWIFMFMTLFATNKNKWSKPNEKKCLESNHVMDEYNLCNGKSPKTPMKIVICAYVLFWDVNSTILNDINLLSLSLPVLLVLVEDLTIVIYHLYHIQATIFLTLASGSCLLCGWMIILIVTTWNKWLILQPCQRKSKETYLHTREKRLPVVDLNPDLNMNGKSSKRNETKRVAEMTISPGVINECTLTDKLSLGRKSNKSGKNKESLQGTNLSGTQRVNDYERINETLMTTENKINQSGMKRAVTLNPETLPGAFLLEAMQIYSEAKIISRLYENTLGSNSSRNTNTISDFEIESHSDKKIDPKPSHQSTPILSSKQKYKVQQRSPLEIRKASKIILNTPKLQTATQESKAANRCCCTVQEEDECVRESDNNIYEKLIEDAYGILIYEGDPTQRTERYIKTDRPDSTSIFCSRKKLKVLCAKCLENHDPLLTDCLENHLPGQKLKNQPQQPGKASSLFIPSFFHSPRVSSETTEYPTDTEFTCNIPEGDELSISTHLSTIHSATYTNLPIKCYFSHILAPKSNSSSVKNPKEFTGTEYVKAWLMMSNDCESEVEINTNFSTCNIKRNENYNNVNNSKVKSYSNINNIITQSHPTDLTKSDDSSQSIKYLKPVFSMTYQPPPKEKQHPSSSLTHLHSQSNKSFQKKVFSNQCNSPRNCKFKELNLHSDLLETIV